MSQKIDPEEAERFLNEQDEKYGVNKAAELVVETEKEPEKITSLGKAQSHQNLVELSAAEESP
jgi:hypothetical protein